MKICYKYTMTKLKNGIWINQKVCKPSLLKTWWLKLETQDRLKDNVWVLFPV